MRSALGLARPAARRCCAPSTTGERRHPAGPDQRGVGAPTPVNGRSPAGFPGAAGTLGLRRRLPNGRAVAGGFAVAAAAVLVFGAYLSTRPAHGSPGVVAAAPLAAGTTLTAGDLRAVDLRLPAATGAEAYRDPTDLVGRTLAVRLDAGELLTPAELTPHGGTPRLRPVSVSVPAGDLVDLAVGDRVDILVTEGSNPDTRTTMVLRGAQVISAAQPSSALADANSGDIVTLGVSDLAEVEAVVTAEHAGTLDVVVGEPSDGSGLGAAPTPSSAPARGP